ncbi:Putative DNA-3-methyladenine glycosidase II（DNA glycosylase,109-291&|uniref:DNA-3-methyladenine glycosylase family protein n=1 Tax=Magnetospirillum sp. XM-1 TaxID=1663591 RepID=UPI00073DDE89|nr:DNA-3-methyladenine glycosylase 2 [Magnetospirillum sp. XM-1]CUW38339.1 Putative DNA-3-methyladenine glycosidase II\
MSKCASDLPATYRSVDILAFHRRDPSMLAERVEGDSLRKGLVWRGNPACLTIRFQGQQAWADLEIDGPASEHDASLLEAMAARMLGLTQRIEAFEAAHGGHALLGRLIADRPGLRLAVAATPFEALAWAVAGQQISVGAAISLRHRLIKAAGISHSSGLFCFPDAAALRSLDKAALRRAGFSQSKTEALMTLSRQIVDGALPLDDWLGGTDMAELAERLLRVRGIGPWTVGYTLLRGYGWLDGSLHGDVAVRRSLQALLDRPDSVGAEEAKSWLAPFSPWRALVAAHLWAWKSTKAY